MRQIEIANPDTLYGILSMFSSQKWTNKAKMPDSIITSLIEDFSVVCADTLENPAFLDGSHLRKFDIVLANPPYSIKEWDREKFMNDKWGRNFLGTHLRKEGQTMHSFSILLLR